MNVANSFISVALNGAMFLVISALVVKPMLNDSRRSNSNEGLVLKVVPTGTIVPFAGVDIPAGWLECNGQTKLVSEFPSLAESLKGGPFWDGRSEVVTLPNMSGRMPIGAGAGNGLTARQVGQAGGAETHSLTVGEMPQHSHGVTDPGHSHGQNVSANPGKGQKVAIRLDMSGDTDDNPAGYYDQGVPTNASKTSITIGNAGEGQSHNNMPPYLVLRFLIKT